LALLKYLRVLRQLIKGKKFMYDSFNRKISYLRISVTDRCNLRCRYCMPPQGIKALNHKEILSYEEITSVVKTLVSFGINKIRLTGGEPLVRKGIENLIGMISALPGICEVTLTTNGVLLNDLAPSLAINGLSRVNISLDTINPERYRQITRGGDISHVIRGIDAALKAGIEPVKINCVINPGTNERELNDLQEFCRERNLELQYIRQMDLASGKFWSVEGGNGGNCRICNRVRLTANGNFIPCLFSEQEFNIRELGIVRAFQEAVESKPIRGKVNTKNKFYNIGG
jgi:cyclic pyranopterin phosphate synthase